MVTFEFYRRNQKLILYTAGIFALLTFSISGAMMSYFSGLGGGGYKGASLRGPDGLRVYVTVDDHRIAQNLANVPLMPRLIPDVGDAKTTSGDYIDILAALRRLAIAYGIDASGKEVEAAMKAVLAVWPKNEGQPPPTAADLVAQSGVPGDQYDLLMRESLRIGTFLRMFAFAADTSDAQLAESIARDIRLLTLKVATLDKKLIEEQLKQTEVSDEDLQKWLNELPEAERGPFLDGDRAAVKAAGVKLADFDPAAFAAELAGKTYDDAAVQARYDQDKALFYRREVKEGEPPPADPYLPLAEVKDSVIKRMQAEDALGVLVDKLRQAMGATLQPLVDARTAANAALAKAKAAQAEADKKAAEKPDDQALATAATEAKAAVTAAEQAHKDAEAAVDAARRAFDLEAELGKLTSAKLTAVLIAEAKNADGLRDLPEFGPWDASWTATSMELAGDIASKVQNTKPGVFLFQVTDLVKKPLKDFAAIKDQVKDAYYKKKADEEAKTKLTVFEDTLKRLAREAKKAEIDTIETEHTATVNQKFDAWKAETEAALAKAKSMRDSLADDQDSVAFKRWNDKFTSVENALKDLDAKRAELEKQVRVETDAKVEKVVKEARASVLDAAAAEVGLAVDTIGPYRKDATSLPRFHEDAPARARFLLGNSTVTQLTEGQASDVLEDFTNRASHLVVMQKVEPGSIADVTRRELMAKRQDFESERMQQTVAQSFTIEALQSGWDYQRAQGDPNRLKPKTASAGAAGGSGAAKTAANGGGGEDQKADAKDKEANPPAGDNGK